MWTFGEGQTRKNRYSTSALLTHVVAMGKSRPYMKKAVVSHKYWIIVGIYDDLLKKYPKTHIRRYSDCGEYIRKAIREGKKRIKVRRSNPCKKNPGTVRYYYTQKGKYVPVVPGDMDYKFGETAEEIEKRYKEFLKVKQNPYRRDRAGASGPRRHTRRTRK